MHLVREGIALFNVPCTSYPESTSYRDVKDAGPCRWGNSTTPALLRSWRIVVSSSSLQFVHGIGIPAACSPFHAFSGNLEELRQALLSYLSTNSGRVYNSRQVWSYRNGCLVQDRYCGVQVCSMRTHPPTLGSSITLSDTSGDHW